jgi:hypothetical protein
LLLVGVGRALAGTPLLHGLLAWDLPAPPSPRAEQMTKAFRGFRIVVIYFGTFRIPILDLIALPSPALDLGVFLVRVLVVVGEVVLVRELVLVRVLVVVGEVVLVRELVLVRVLVVVGEVVLVRELVLIVVLICQRLVFGFVLGLGSAVNFTEFNVVKSDANVQLFRAQQDVPGDVNCADR